MIIMYCGLLSPNRVGSFLIIRNDDGLIKLLDDVVGGVHEYVVVRHTRLLGQ